MASGAEGASSEQQNTLFNALANHRRRFALYACDQAGGNITLSDLATQVAAWEYDKELEAITSNERKRVYTSLQQHHLSTLEDAGLIDVDGDRITLTDRGERIDLYLEVVTADTIPWSLYYLGFSVIAAGAIGLAYLEVLPQWVTLARMTGLVLFVLGFSAIVHHFDIRRKQLGESEVGTPSSL